MFKIYQKFADVLVDYSCEIKAGEKVIIEQEFVDNQFLAILAKTIRERGAYPIFVNRNSMVTNTLVELCDEQYCDLLTKYYLPVMQDADATILIRGSNNLYESSEIPAEKQNIYTKRFMTPVHLDERVNNTKWVLSNWPTAGLAQAAEMSLAKYTDLFFKVCTLDYSKMSRAMDNLVTVLERTERVRIVANGTDLTFSIKDIPAVKCAGKNNIPDGEVFTAPVKDSVNGIITYNVPTVYNGKKFENICLKVKEGKIYEATCSGKTKELNEILDTDFGSRYFGEFAIGVNPYITEATGDILFDEKMKGSIHLTPGCCYDECPNDNKSSVHWDMILSQTPEFGGGELYFDGVLVRKDGIFTLPELKCLNPENLV